MLSLQYPESIHAIRPFIVLNARRDLGDAV